MASEPRKLTAIVVGTSFGLRAHVPGLQLAGYDIVALVGRDAEKTARRAGHVGIPHSFTSLPEALALKPDLVAVTTGPAEHYELSAAALDAGANVLCEKPFTLDLEQAKDLERRAAKGGLVACLAHEFRFTPSLALFGRVLSEGAIGQPRTAAIFAQTPLLSDPEGPRPDWWFDPARGGGWLGASGSHGVDLIRGWLGELAAVSCRVSVTSDRPRDVADDTFTLNFVTRSGVEGVYHSSGAVWGEAATVLRVAGSKGTVRIDDESHSGNIEATYGPVMVSDRAGTHEVPVPADLAIEPYPEYSQRAHSVPQFVRLFRIMGDQIRGGAPATNPGPATFSDGVANMRVLEAARASSKDGGRWNLARRDES